MDQYLCSITALWDNSTVSQRVPNGSVAYNANLLMNALFLSFPPFLSHFLHSLNCISWDHLPKRLPVRGDYYFRGGGKYETKINAMKQRFSCGLVTPAGISQGFE